MGETREARSTPSSKKSSTPSQIDIIFHLTPILPPPPKFCIDHTAPVPYLWCMFVALPVLLLGYNKLCMFAALNTYPEGLSLIAKWYKIWWIVGLIMGQNRCIVGDIFFSSLQSHSALNLSHNASDIWYFVICKKPYLQSIYKNKMTFAGLCSYLVILCWVLVIINIKVKKLDEKNRSVRGRDS